MRKKYNIKTMTQIAMLIALSMIGATIKIQGSIAFDSMAAFFAALYIGPLAGGMVGVLGHLLSAATAGFPMTIPMHILVAFQMLVFVYVFGWVYTKAPSWVAILIGTFLNGPVGALLAVPVSLMLGFGGWPLFLMIWMPLTIASFANIVLATVVYKTISRGKR
ncbi:dimethylbenzimidazole transporter [Clostridium aceticum]|nr:dimethylbenzimidazole transporter [Clostridium aceticum]